MTVMTADRTGGMQIIRADAPSGLDSIVADLRGPVWILLTAPGLPEAARDAAVTALLASRAGEAGRIWHQEVVGVTTTRVGCTSPHHEGENCAAALAGGLLAEGVPFCDFCTEQQRALPAAPTEEIVTGRVVHVVTRKSSSTRGRKVS
jgi:hypothetical protein